MEAFVKIIAFLVRKVLDSPSLLERLFKRAKETTMFLGSQNK